MGSQTTTNNDRSRTYWTPTMERYFLDLMLEHIHKGNRVGHTFNKQAWTDMLNTFNAKFGSQYDKDALKSRYTILWKQFNDVKHLLGQNDFSWDGARQMVTAPEYVWDAYIKAHPDARSYRTRPVLNFTDLCFIYGYATADGRYSRSSHDMDIDDEIHGVDSGPGMGALACSSSERSRTDWTLEMDQHLIDLMLGQLRRSSKSDSAFNKTALTEMLSLFNSRFGPQHNKRALRHRYRKLWKYYSDITGLLKQKGFSWDETQQKVTADDDVWDVYVKAHPHARLYRGKQMPNYEDLVLIYGNAAANVEACNHLHGSKNIKGVSMCTKTGGGCERQAATASDRSRTYWTPPMDRYLVDLLLEQVHKGNRLGQTFISQAWVDMAASFSLNFNAHYDKEVLKNRCKHLRRQYNKIKSLLEHDGFSWDDARGTVIAEDHVWDAYAMVHTDARCYRVKAVPNYQKLHVIFGKESSDQRYSRLACDADPGGDISHFLHGEGNDSPQVRADNDFPRIDWTPSMDRHLIDLVRGQIREGHNFNHMLSEQAWVRIVASFQANFGPSYDRYVLEKQYMGLMKEHDDINTILSHSGFAWDGYRQMLVADDMLWEAYIEEHPDSIAYRDKILGNYDDMCLIMGKGIPEEVPRCEGLGMMDMISADLHGLDHGEKRRPATLPLPAFPSSKKFRKSTDGRISMEDAVCALQAIPDMDDELVLDACDLLEDERKAKTFLALDATLRKKWLLRKLRP